MASVVAFGISTVIGVKNAIRNSYAVWWVADMVVEHLDANDDEWPKDWGDLRDDYQTCVINARAQPWEFDELKRRVGIDWNAEPIDLVARQINGEPEFRAIWLADGSNSNWADAEPNQIVLDYLNRKK